MVGEHAYMAFALLSNHPDCNGKYGCGLKAIRYGVNDKFPDTKCFIAVRMDDTVDGFSYRKCIDAAFENVRQQGRGEKRGRDYDDDRGSAKVPPPPARPAALVWPLRGQRAHSTFPPARLFKLTGCRRAVRSGQQRNSSTSRRGWW